LKSMTPINRIETWVVQVKKRAVLFEYGPLLFVTEFVR
jgi:hypothetical protein